MGDPNGWTDESVEFQRAKRREAWARLGAHGVIGLIAIALELLGWLDGPWQRAGARWNRWSMFALMWIGAGRVVSLLAEALRKVEG